MIKFTAQPRLLASTDGKPSRLHILAYTGAPMAVSGFGNVLIDIAGLQLGTVPILDGHENMTQALIGQGTSRAEAGQLLVEGDFAPTQAGKETRDVLAAGVSLQASIGVDPTKTRMLKSGEKITANGRTWELDRPTLFVETGVLKEVSCLPLGADSGTQTIAAKQGGHKMPDNNVVDPVVTERERVDGIHSTFASVGFSEQARVQAAAVRSQAIAEGWTVDAAKAAFLDLLRASRPTPTLVTGGGHGGNLERRHLEAALLVRCGFEGLAEKVHGAQVMEASRPLHRMSLPDLAVHSLRMQGLDATGGRDAMLRAAFSSGDMPTALGNTANKILLSQYEEAPSPWRSFAQVKSASDFKTQTSIRPTFTLDLEQLAPNGEIKHGSFGEEYFQWSIDTYAKMLSVGRKDIVNDDLGAFADVLPSMARASARKLNDLVATTMLSSATTFWTTGRANYFEGGSTNLSATSLATAIRMLRQMKDADNNLIDLEPTALLVPVELEVTARELLQSSEVWRYTSASIDRQPSGNVMQNVATLAVDARLSDTGYTGYSATAWWLFGPREMSSVVVGFLMGKTAPTVEVSDSDFNTLGVQLRVYHDFGVALSDYRTSIRSKGSA